MPGPGPPAHSPGGFHSKVAGKSPAFSGDGVLLHVAEASGASVLLAWGKPPRAGVWLTGESSRDERQEKSPEGAEAECLPALRMCWLEGPGQLNRQLCLPYHLSC